MDSLMGLGIGPGVARDRPRYVPEHHILVRIVAYWIDRDQRSASASWSMARASSVIGRPRGSNFSVMSPASWIVWRARDT